MLEALQYLLRTEPARLGEAVLAVVAVVATVTDFIDPVQATAVVAAIVSVLEVLRSIVYAPATVETLVANAIQED